MTERWIRLKRLVWRELLIENFKNVWMKQFCCQKVWEFATVFRIRKLFGTFEKPAPQGTKVITNHVSQPEPLWTLHFPPLTFITTNKLVVFRSLTSGMSFTSPSPHDPVWASLSSLAPFVAPHPGTCCYELFAPNYFTWDNWSPRSSKKMDVADRTTGTSHVRDDLAERCQKLFQDFLEE